MGNIRSEIYTKAIQVERKSYFFNVKENRNGDVFLQIVESKGIDGDRHDIVIFAEDMPEFFKGLDETLKIVDKECKDRKKARQEKRAERDAKYSLGNKNKSESTKKVYRRKGESRLISQRRQEALKEEEQRERMAGPMADAERRASGVEKTDRVIHVTSKRSSSDN